MIVLDTNVLSELTKHEPDPAVLAWLDEQWNDSLATTATTVAEMLYGVERLPVKRRRRDLAGVLEAWLNDDLQGRVMPFDLAAAREYAKVVAEREAAGRPIGIADGQIAAICRSRNARLATRNTSDFEDTGVALINPWEA